jgi:hypothetical protein
MKDMAKTKNETRPIPTKSLKRIAHPYFKSTKKSTNKKKEDIKQEDNKEDQTPARSSSSPPPPSRIKNLIRKFTIFQKSEDFNDVSTSTKNSNSNLEGGRIRPIGCSLTESQRLDTTVTKSAEILHHSDWRKLCNIGQSSESGVWTEQEDL